MDEHIGQTSRFGSASHTMTNFQYTGNAMVMIEQLNIILHTQTEVSVRTQATPKTLGQDPDAKYEKILSALQYRSLGSIDSVNEKIPRRQVVDDLESGSVRVGLPINEAQAAQISAVKAIEGNPYKRQTQNG